MILSAVIDDAPTRTRGTGDNNLGALQRTMLFVYICTTYVVTTNTSTPKTDVNKNSLVGNPGRAAAGSGRRARLVTYRLNAAVSADIRTLLVQGPLGVGQLPDGVFALERQQVCHEGFGNG